MNQLEKEGKPIINGHTSNVYIQGLHCDFNEESEQAHFYVDKINENSKNLDPSNQHFLWQSQKWYATLYDERELPYPRKKKKLLKRTVRRRSKDDNEGDKFEITETLNRNNKNASCCLREYLWKPKSVNIEESFTFVTYIEKDRLDESTEILDKTPHLTSYKFNASTTNLLEETFNDDSGDDDDDDDDENLTCEKPLGALAKLTYISEKLLHIEKENFNSSTNEEMYITNPINVKLLYEQPVTWVQPYEGKYGFSTSHFQVSERYGDSYESQLLRVTTKGGYLSDFSLSFSEARKVKTFKKRRKYFSPNYNYIPDDVIIVDKLERVKEEKTFAKSADDIRLENITFHSIVIDEEDEGFEDIELPLSNVIHKVQSEPSNIENFPENNSDSPINNHNTSIKTNLLKDLASKYEKSLSSSIEPENDSAFCNSGSPTQNENGKNNDDMSDMNKEPCYDNVSEFSEDKTDIKDNLYIDSDIFNELNNFKDKSIKTCDLVTLTTDSEENILIRETYNREPLDSFAEYDRAEKNETESNFINSIKPLIINPQNIIETEEVEPTKLNPVVKDFSKEIEVNSDVEESILDNQSSPDNIFDSLMDEIVTKNPVEQKNERNDSYNDDVNSNTRFDSLEKSSDDEPELEKLQELKPNETSFITNNITPEVPLEKCFLNDKIELTMRDLDGNMNSVNFLPLKLDSITTIEAVTEGEERNEHTTVTKINNFPTNMAIEEEYSESKFQDKDFDSPSNLILDNDALDELNQLKDEVGQRENNILLSVDCENDVIDGKVSYEKSSEKLDADIVTDKNDSEGKDINCLKPLIIDQQNIIECENVEPSEHHSVVKDFSNETPIDSDIEESSLENLSLQKNIFDDLLDRVIEEKDFLQEKRILEKLKDKNDDNISKICFSTDEEVIIEKPINQYDINCDEGSPAINILPNETCSLKTITLAEVLMKDDYIENNTYIQPASNEKIMISEENITDSLCDNQQCEVELDNLMNFGSDIDSVQGDESVNVSHDFEQDSIEDKQILNLEELAYDTNDISKYSYGNKKNTVPSPSKTYDKCSQANEKSDASNDFDKKIVNEAPYDESKIGFDMNMPEFDINNINKEESEGFVCKSPDGNFTNNEPINLAETEFWNDEEIEEFNEDNECLSSQNKTSSLPRIEKLKDVEKTQDNEPHNELEISNESSPAIKSKRKSKITKKAKSFILKPFKKQDSGQPNNTITTDNIETKKGSAKRYLEKTSKKLSFRRKKKNLSDPSVETEQLTTVKERINLLRQNSSDNIFDEPPKSEDNKVKLRENVQRKPRPRSRSFNSMMDFEKTQNKETKINNSMNERRRRLAGYSFVNSNFRVSNDIIKSREYTIEACEREYEKETRLIKTERKKFNEKKANMSISIDRLQKLHDVGKLNIPYTFISNNNNNNRTKNNNVDPNKNVGKIEIPRAFSLDNILEENVYRPAPIRRAGTNEILM